MAGEQKRKARQTLVTKALLLGYQIVQDNLEPEKCQLILPDGKVWYAWVHNPRTGKSDGPFTYMFPAHWLAAKKALEHAGVLDAKKSQRDERAHSRKGDRLRQR